MAEVITTIGQLLERYYGRNFVQKINAPILTSTTGVYNAVFGAMAFSQLNNEANVFGILPKYPWQKSGWRAITADAGSTAGGGVTENGTIPDTIKPTFQEITVTAKQVAHTFDVSYIHEGLVKSGDDSLGDMSLLRGYFATLHAKRINEMLCVDANTLAGNNLESIDRVTGSYAGLITNLSYTAGDEDIYGIDRSTYSWADAVMDENAGTDRVLTDKLIRDNLATIENNGGRTNILLTGSDTKYRLMGLYENQVRYPGVKGEMRLQVGVNGVQTDEGAEVGLRISTVYGIPLFVSQAVTKDTISRVYLLDTTMQEESGIPRLGIALLYPTLYAESGMSAPDQNPFAINRFGTQGVFYTAGELVCTFFKGQGSIRDLK